MMKITISVIVLGASLLTGCISSSRFEGAVPWPTEDVAQMLWGHDADLPKVLSMKTLAWMTVKSGSIILDDCIIWAKVVRQERVQWLLVRCERNPADTRGWRLWAVTHLEPEEANARQYDHAPTQEESQEFLKACWWSFSGERDMQDFRLCQAGIPVENWRSCFGQNPPQSYFDELAAWYDKTNSPSSQPAGSLKQPEKK